MSQENERRSPASVVEHDDNQSAFADAADRNAKLKYPRAVFIILTTKLLERIAFYGFRAVLVLYLTQQLQYDDNEATVIFHTMNVLVFCCCIPGAIFSDCWLGKYWSSMLFSGFYLFGIVLLVVSAANVWVSSRTQLTLVGLAFIACSTGATKPLLLSLGGDQFRLPEQSKQLARYYAMAYTILKLGFLIGSAITPILRHDFSCFNETSCFAGAFGLSTVLIMVAYVLFASGYPIYIIRPPVGNMLMQTWSCVCTALRNKRRHSRSLRRQHQPQPQQPPPHQLAHWLDYASAEHGARMVVDTKYVLNMLVLLAPIVPYYALNEQVGSRWTLQATHMSGDLFGWYTVKPDQVALVVQLLVIAFIWAYERFGHRWLAERFGCSSMLQRMAFGCSLTALSFCAAGLLQLKLDTAQPEAQLHTTTTVHMVWALPQYACLAAGEALVGVNGWTYAYASAPASMRTVIPALWMLAAGMGNAIDVLLVSVGVVQKQYLEFFMFGGIGFLNMLAFAWLITHFRPSDAMDDVDDRNLEASPEEIQPLR